ncbi:hypothetical protein THAOC_33127 [Thalassiosira oceanica]|uniref:GrpE protein homolog n=1 Tax=Thalassiosira oceanica TaxID=159749 RepID=K0RMY4_THAOC|nr:hypothetical protein THAOC_33127 [Thalassiosira oceanica]|eukprot:EJK48102.1 hypothetical protein THAOC_33127 [Thalassiosira oceanica]
MIRCGLVAVSLPLLAFGFGTLPHVKLASRQPSVSALFSEEASADDASSDASTSEEEQAASPPSEDTSDILNSPAFLTRKVEVLQSDIAAMEKEIEEANALYTAGKAEWGTTSLVEQSQLMQERFAEQGAQGKETATVEVAQKILNVLDNYDRAFQSVEAATNEEVEIVDAYKNTYDMILDAFSELNVTKVETVGTEFDYEMHQAMMQMPSDEYEEGIVCQEFAMGWKCGEKLIRPAMVAVAA